MKTLKKVWGYVDEKTFAMAWILATITALYFLAPGYGSVMTEIILLKMVYVAILLTVMVGLLYFLRGTEYDVYEEIFAQDNSAAGILVGALLLACAIVIGK